ncbi:MAG: Ig-like domain-containing protein [Cocleimonas sp.]
MKNNQSKSYKWAYLPFVFSSAAILANSAIAAPYTSQQYKDAKQVSSVNHEYVGGSGTQVGVSVTDQGDIGLELNQVISESANSSTSVGLWGDYDLKGDDKGFQGRGAQVNHNWVSTKGGRVSHVNKVTAAYDQSASGHSKATVGYGQETENSFWDVHASKGLSGKQKAGAGTSEKSYDYGVGAGVGTFLKGSNMRVRAGLDHEWGEAGENEATAKNTTLSAGIEKFFQGTGHSLGLDVAASKKSGGLDNGSNDTKVNGRLAYRYDFGGASIYQPDRRYKRVRVEVPGKAVAPRYAQQRTFKRVPTYKTVPTYAKKTVRKPYKQLVKSTMGLEGQTFFKLNSAKLIPSAQTRLKQIATQIRKNGYKGSIRITGNTCGLGNAVYDQRLSEQRAQAVRAFLVKNGFNANHLVARGLGKGHPKYPNTPDQGFKNRRVDIEYVSERKAYKTGYRTETQNVRTGTRRVATGFKNVPTGAKNVMVSSGRPGAPRVIWKTEVIPTSPAWIKRALHNNIKHDRNVNTFISTDPVAPSNVAPVAKDDSATTPMNTPVTLTTLSNDSDADGDTLTITNIQNPANGSAVVSANGQGIVYTPNPGFVGTDTFTYTITDGNGHTVSATETVTVSAPANVAPVAQNDSATTPVNTPVTLTTLSNDSDADGDKLTITNIQSPSNGSAVVSANGQGIVYTPNPGFVGTDTFTYTITDGKGHTVSATETVTIVAAANTAPTANDDTVTTPFNTPVTLNTIANDTDPENDSLIITSVVQPAANVGTATISADKKTIVFTPANGFVGTVKFDYFISDGNGGTASAVETVTVSNAPNTAPTANDDTVTTPFNTPVTLNTIANDTDPENDSLIITSVVQPAANVGTATISADKKTIVFTPANGFVGTVKFDYFISDGNGGTASAVETVTVSNAPNVAPVAQDDSATTPMNTPVTLTTLSNDSDADGDKLTITNIQSPSNGSASVSANGQGIVYTPNPGFVGTDTFTYTITDGNGHTVSATETVTITAPANVAPVAQNDSATATCNAVTINVLGNDTDADLDTLSLLSISNASLGNAVINGNTVVYTPSSTCGQGTDTFSYTISDGNGHTATANIVVDVQGTPGGCNTGCTVAEPDDIATMIDTPVSIDVLSNDTGSGLNIIEVDVPDNGTAVISGGQIVYTPAPGFTGTDSFWYDIEDSKGYGTSALIVVYVEDPSNF